jgi:CO/xanthine dehydrogenase FAD-binding subunit
MTAHASLQPPRSPVRLDDALELLAQPGWLPLAGGTDVFPAHVGRPLVQPLLDLSRIDALRGQGRVADAQGRVWWRIGALETWSAVRDAPLPPGLEALVQAALEVGGRQIQNQGTLGGNLCNASPAADGVPVLLALDAQVELRSRAGSRRLALAEFVLGNRRTALAPGELLVAIHLPLGSPRARSQFLKLGHRRYLVISIAMVAVSVDADPQNRLARCAVAVGACSAAARRLPRLEERLLGLPPSQAAGAAASALASGDAAALLAPLSPIDDVRGTAGYRREAVRELIGRAIAMACATPDAAA